MKIETAYIISYLPSDQTREKRKEAHKKQLEYFRSFHPDLKFVIYAQGYTVEDFHIRDDIYYIVNDGEIKRPGPARNELLKYFYESDEDFGLFLDDDMIFYSGEKYCDSDNIISMLRDCDSDFSGVDVFDVLNPTQTPFSKDFEDNNDILTRFFQFKAKSQTSGASLFIKNFKKYYDKEYYYSNMTNEDGTVKMGEDVEFGIRLLKEGMRIYMLKNVVRKDLAQNHSTWCKSVQHRQDSFKELTKEIESWGIEKKGKSFDQSGFLKKYSIPRELYISKHNVKELFS